MEEKDETRAKEERREYRKPRPIVHGDLRAITLTKKGTKNDGSGKPQTRVNGPMS
jgi:hypothetical protein